MEWSDGESAISDAGEWKWPGYGSACVCMPAVPCAGAKLARLGARGGTLDAGDTNGLRTLLADRADTEDRSRGAYAGAIGSTGGAPGGGRDSAGTAIAMPATFTAVAGWLGDGSVARWRSADEGGGGGGAWGWCARRATRDDSGMPPPPPPTPPPPPPPPPPAGNDGDAMCRWKGRSRSQSPNPPNGNSRGGRAGEAAGGVECAPALAKPPAWGPPEAADSCCGAGDGYPASRRGTPGIVGVGGSDAPPHGCGCGCV